MASTSDRLALIVEHDVWLRCELRALFEYAGFEVVCASNGFGGLRRAVELRPRLIVLGAVLPELAPAELAEELRAVHHFGRTQIVSAEEVLSGGWPTMPADAPGADAGVSRLRARTKAPTSRPALHSVAQSNRSVGATP